MAVLFSFFVNQGNGSNKFLFQITRVRDSLDGMSENGNGEKIQEKRREGREKVQENGGAGNFIFYPYKYT